MYTGMRLHCIILMMIAQYFTYPERTLCLLLDQGETKNKLKKCVDDVMSLGLGATETCI